MYCLPSDPGVRLGHHPSSKSIRIQTCRFLDRQEQGSNASWKGAGDSQICRIEVRTHLRFRTPIPSRRSQTAGRLWDLVQELQSLDSSLPWKPPKNELQSAYGNEPGVLQPNMAFVAGNPGPSSNFPGPTHGFYEQHGQSFEPGTSIEQLLADTPVLDTAATNGWRDSSGLANEILDDEIMSMWMAVPTDFM